MIMPRPDIKFIAGFSLLLIFLTTAPYLYGYLTTPPNQTFTGFGLYSWFDTPVYYGYIEQIKQGNFLLQDLHTSEPQRPFFNIFWLALGLVAKIFSLSPTLIFHLTKLVLVPILVYSIFIFLRLFITSSIKLKTALVFLTLASGCGIIFWNWLPFPYNYLWDFSIPETTIFQSIYSSPHFIASWILIILSFYFLTNGYLKNRTADIIKAGLAALILTQFHPFYALLLITVPTVYAFILYLKEKNNNHLIKWLVFELFLAPSILYYLYLQSDAIFNLRSQNLMLSPPPLTIILAFGLTFFLAAGGLALVFKKHAPSKAWLFIVVWFFTNLFLLYAPVPFQRRLIEGWMIPLGLLALLALNEFLPQLKKIQGKFVTLAIFAGLAIFLFSFSNLVIWKMSFDFYQNKIPPLYLTADEIKAFDWIKNNASDQAVFLTNNFIDGNILPAMTGKKVFWGHGFETVNFDQKTNIINKLFSSDDANEQIAILKNNKITHLFWNAGLPNQFNPETKPFLTKVFTNRTVQIYEVN